MKRNEPHLDALTLARYLAKGDAGNGAELRLFVRHIVSGCPECLTALRELSELDPGESDPGGTPEGLDTDRLFEEALARSGALDRLTGLALGRGETFRREKEQALGASEKVFDEGLWDGRESRLVTRASCEQLLQRARRIWSDEPELAASLLRLALQLSSRLDEDFYGAANIRDLQARILAYQGNVHRLMDEYLEAEIPFARALKLLEQGSGDSTVRASIYSLLATLRGEQRRFAEADRLLDDVIHIYRRAGDDHLVGRTLLQQAHVAEIRGERDRSLALIGEARSLLDFGREPRLELLSLHNYLNLLAETTEASDARRLLEDNRGLYLSLGDATLDTRLPWLEGKIALSLGELEEAETKLRRAQEALLDLSSPVAWGLASLDLAAVLVRQSRFEEIQDLAAVLLETFSNHGFQQQAFASLTILLQAAEAQAVTEGILRETALALRRAPRPTSPPAS